MVYIRVPDQSREFPILKGRRRSIPWEMIAPHESQAIRNHDQTLEALAQRGGLSPEEAMAVLQGKALSWPSGESHQRAEDQLDAEVAEWEHPPEACIHGWFRLCRECPSPCEGCGGRCGPEDWEKQKSCCPDCTCRPIVR